MTAAKRPQPLLNRAAITSAVAGLVSLLVTLGVLPATVGAQLSHTADAVIAAVVLIMSTVPAVVHAFASRGVVTPTADPVSDDGFPLVEYRGDYTGRHEADGA